MLVVPMGWVRVWVIFGSDMPWAEAWLIQHVCASFLSCHLLFLFMLEFVLVASLFEVVLCHSWVDSCCAFVLLECCPVVVLSVVLPCCCCCFLCSLNSCVDGSSFWWLRSLRLNKCWLPPCQLCCDLDGLCPCVVLCLISICFGFGLGQVLGELVG